MSGADSEATRDSDERIQRIVDRARREVGVRDLTTFCVARIWTALQVVGAACSTWHASRDRDSQSPPEQQ